ncbi:MAG: hemolysin [Pedosphaera sp.]|nr:hemolysin [Pedosphaera sp.]
MIKPTHRFTLRAGVAHTALPTYAVRLSASAKDLRAVQALRFQVFNIELNEGLERSYETCLDADPFDEVFDHLLVEETRTGEVVGAYRMQTGRRAREAKGYYSEQEFDFAPFEPYRDELVELGRAAVHREHRNLAVLSLLWKGIAAYARERNCWYLTGCSSLTSQDPSQGAAIYQALKKTHLASPEFQTQPLSAVACPLERLAERPGKVPKLLAAYLTLGGFICGPPAIDRDFKTIDFLTLLDLRNLSPRAMDRFLG